MGNCLKHVLEQFRKYYLTELGVPFRSGVGGNCVRQDNVSGGHIFLGNSVLPDRIYILSTLGQIVRVRFLTNSIVKGTDDGF